MAERSASVTARGVAMLRAAHQFIDGAPRILDDSVIARLFGPGTEAYIRGQIDRYRSRAARGLRSHVLLRSRFTEDSLCEAVPRGIQQYVLLGAGLDTFAYRQPSWAEAIEIIEVDHPSSQADKRRLLAEAGIAIPANVRYVDIDFEHETLMDGLRRCRVAFDRPTFFSWLGVTMYLTRDAIDAVLDTVVSFAKGSEIVLTYAQPPEPGDQNAGFFAERAAAIGEPWLSYFEPPAIAALLAAHGFSDARFLTRDDAVRQYYAGRSDGLAPPRRISIVSATV